MKNISSVIKSSILLSESTVSNIQCLDSYKDETLSESYFYETMQFCRDIKESYNNANAVLYRSLLESKSDAIIIHESFDGFFSTIKNIINKIIDFIKTLFNKFIVALNRFFQREKFLTNHLKDLSSFAPANEFKFDGFKFTIFPNIPVTTTIEQFSISGNTDLVDSDMNDSSAITKKYDALTVLLDDDYYDKVRADVLGLPEGDSVYQSDFANVLFSTFRNDESSKEQIDVTSAGIQEYINSFKNYKAIKDMTKKNKDSLEKAYARINKDLDATIKHINSKTTITYKNYSGIAVTPLATTTTPSIDVTKTSANAMDLFIKAKISQIQQLSNIHSLAFAAKLDAINDNYKQDKSVLYKALYKIQGDLVKGGK